MKKIKRMLVVCLVVLMLVGVAAPVAVASGWGTGNIVTGFPANPGVFQWRQNLRVGYARQQRACWASISAGVQRTIGAQTVLMDSMGRDIRSSGIQQRTSVGNFSVFSNRVMGDTTTQTFGFFTGTR